LEASKRSNAAQSISSRTLLVIYPPQGVFGVNPLSLLKAVTDRSIVMRMILISNKSFRLSLDIYFLILSRLIKLSSETVEQGALACSGRYITVRKQQA